MKNFHIFFTISITFISPLFGINGKSKTNNTYNIKIIEKEKLNHNDKNQSNLASNDIEIIDDPSKWSLWRTGPIPFPTEMLPSVPENLEGDLPINIGDRGNDLTIILPDINLDNIHEKALLEVAKWYRVEKWMDSADIISISNLSDELLNRQIIILGTIESNSLVKDVLGNLTENFMKDVTPGGYHIKAFDSPWNKNKKVILALGNDMLGAWRAAIIICCSIHSWMHTGKVGKLHRWPIDLPEGFFWAPFEAKFSGYEEIPPPKAQTDLFEVPEVPFGVRNWGSPTPTINTFKKMINVLKQFGINSMVIQVGGWPDLKNPGAVCKEAIDYAYNCGVFIWLYVGNDKKSHYPAPLTDRHREIVMAVKDHPGLLGWRLYNQLTSNLSFSELEMIKNQIKWLKNVSDKPIGMELVWGHDAGVMPEDKAKLIKNLIEWGVDEIAHDYAPIGGWSKNHDISLWEKRLKSLYEFEDEPFVVLQGHIPFVEPTLPTPAELRNQFWWCIVGGAKAFFFEAAYIFKHFSIRGLLTWTLEPVPDGRLEEVKRLSQITQKLKEVIKSASFSTHKDIKNLGIKIIEGSQKTSIRLLFGNNNIRYLVFINDDLNNLIEIKFSLPDNILKREPYDIVNEKNLSMQGKSNLYSLSIIPGGGACIKLEVNP
jgi:hypothetical protein